MLRRTLLAMARNDRLKDLATSMPVSAGVVARFVAGEDVADALRVAGELAQFDFTLGRPTPGGQFQPPSTLTGVAGVPQAVLLGERP